MPVKTGACTVIRVMLRGDLISRNRSLEGDQMTGEDIAMPTWELARPDDALRVEISNPGSTFDFQLSDETVQQIRQLEEAVVTAEQRVGLFRVG